MIDLICCGAINWDINFFVDKLPRTGEEVRINKIQRVSGGTAANVSVAAARILGRDRVALIGAVGYDEIGDVQIDLMMKEGVDTSSIIRIKGEESVKRTSQLTTMVKMRYIRISVQTLVLVHS